ncbi:MAG: hypothetical protein OS130_05990 [Thermodesulfobacteriota bacterium]|nr:MAG: hypothetical protein OS130_05990 [Thermodesulfobacteriota bacterium]
MSLYPGTKHSTATDLKNTLDAELAREATRHSTNKALERYIIGDPEDLRDSMLMHGLTKD